MKKIFGWVLISFVLCNMLSIFVYAQTTNDSLADMELFKYYWIAPLMINVHKEIWMWHSEEEIIYSYSSLLQNIRNYTDIDVLLYLKKTIYPQSALDSFLSRSETLLNMANIFILHIDNAKKDFVQKKNNCDNIKEVSDKNFSLALKDFDSVNMEKYLKLSIENEKCSVDARINYNAYDKMQSQIKYYYDILQKKYDYFYTYKYDIINSMAY